MKNLNIEYDKQQDIVTIEGVRYAGGLFRHLGVHGVAVGTVLKIMRREDGEIFLQEIIQEGKGEHE